ncbi:DUF5108 domain-containing protein [Bacteroides sp. 224]|uniref:DUF5108 domain-containing protein n=1 Tax=Bacteroides sp. 224 TaxID=2302936 RepID=UPI0013D3D6A7|nr:DUF5108 domain-containing protein [Bacteroides sp. 224]NDV65343.1 DUF5108 domain-containing protein [Bacteroides sp. 224]
MKNIVKLYLLLFVALYSCDDPYEDSTYQIYDVNPVSTYLETRSDEFSEWIEVLKYADLFNAVNQANESFTVFVPGNEAVKTFYKRKNVTSIQDLGKEYARGLAKYHIIGDSISLDEFILGGKLEKRTLSDDYLTVTFGEDAAEVGGLNSLYLNKEAHVEEASIQVSNGYVYVLNAVLNPLIETVYERITDNGSYKIFAEALELTTWKDSLNVVYEQIKQPNGITIQQKRDYTVFAVTDEAFNSVGVTSVSDLVLKLGAGSNYTDKENDLFLYTGYHIMKGSYSLFELQTFDGNAKKKLWDTMAGAIIEISQESDKLYYLNYDGGEQVRAQFVEKYADVQAKNGMLHQVSSYFPIWESVVPTRVEFDFCNYPEVAAYVAANGDGDQVYQTVHSSTEYNTLVDHLACYNVYVSPSGVKGSFNTVGYHTAKSGNAWKNNKYGDQIMLNVGNQGYIEMKTPAIITGKYKVTLYFCFANSMDFMRTATSGSNGGMMEFSFDGEHKKSFAPYLTVPSKTLGTYPYVIYDENEPLEFTKTGTHTLKILVNDPAASTNSSFRIQMDYMLFEPIITEEP